MTSKELADHLSVLSLTQTEAAQLLDVAPRTVRRWIAGEEIPGPVEQAFLAWRRLHERNLAWRPDSIAIIENDRQQIAALRDHAIAISDMLVNVEARGGPRLPWLIDCDGCRAILGPMEVSFYKLTSGGFSLGNYTRKDGNPDVKRDWEFIEEAAFYIAQEIKKKATIPVTLVYLDAPMWYGPHDRVGMVLQHEEFSSSEAAIQRACELMQGPNFHNPCIRAGRSNEPGEVIWNEPKLRREYDRRMKTKT
jgi:hypothetical protein